MSKQSKLAKKAVLRGMAKKEGRKGPSGASGYPHKQPAPPWVRGGKRVPKKVKELREKRKESVRVEAIAEHEATHEA